MLARKAGEIGMHLHAWNTPPLEPLTEDDFQHHPYLTEYSEQIMRHKITLMTDLLEETFGQKIVSHRAGRWGFNNTYSRLLLEKGYQVDCSVVPHVSMKCNTGNPTGDGGPDYSYFSEQAYFIDWRDISRPGNSSLPRISQINVYIPGCFW